jgi:3-methyladenine DNA glycosylase AlkC
MKAPQSEKFSLKDHLFNPGKINQIAKEIAAVYPIFQSDRFIHETLIAFPQLELKERMVHIADCLKIYLPKSYPEALEILLTALPEPCNPNLSDNDFGDFIYAPYSHFVVVNGCNKKHLEISLDALEQITTRFSVEDAIRYFINAFPQQLLEKLMEWTKHPHYHVRRLASEGSRPKLPWSQKINLSLEQSLPILEMLYTDATRFVTRSVANHLNDISKTQPQLVITTLQKWKNSKAQNAKEMDFIIRHALRTLIKSGDKDALKLIGIGQNPPIQLLSFTVPDSVIMDAYLGFDFEIKAQKEASLLLDYVIYFVNKAGEMKSKKVFKLKHLTLKEGENVRITKKHLLKQFMTTRTLYPGQHVLQLQINGMLMHEKKFILYKSMS